MQVLETPVYMLVHGANGSPTRIIQSQRAQIKNPRTKEGPMKLDRPVLIEGRQKNTLLVSIDLIIKNTRNKVLLGLRNDESVRSCWFVPGSRICKIEFYLFAYIIFYWILSLLLILSLFRFYIHILTFLEDSMANGFAGKKKHRLNRKKYLLKRRRRKHEKVWYGIYFRFLYRNSRYGF